MCVHVALHPWVRRGLSSYEPALLESHSSSLCLVRVRSLTLACGLLLLYLGGRMAKMEYDGARCLLGASLVVPHSPG